MWFPMKLLLRKKNGPLGKYKGSQVWQMLKLNVVKNNVGLRHPINDHTLRPSIRPSLRRLFIKSVFHKTLQAFLLYCKINMHWSFQHWLRNTFFLPAAFKQTLNSAHPFQNCVAREGHAAQTSLTETWVTDVKYCLDPTVTVLTLLCSVHAASTPPQHWTLTLP